MGMRSQLAAQFMHETYSLHKDSAFANELNPAKSALKISQCLLKLSWQNCQKAINTLK